MGSLKFIYLSQRTFRAVKYVCRNATTRIPPYDGRATYLANVFQPYYKAIKVKYLDNVVIETTL